MIKQLIGVDYTFGFTMLSTFNFLSESNLGFIFGAISNYTKRDIILALLNCTSMVNHNMCFISPMQASCHYSVMQCTLDMAYTHRYKTLIAIPAPKMVL